MDIKTILIKILLMEKKYLCALMEECLHIHNGEVEKVKKLENSRNVMIEYVIYS